MKTSPFWSLWGWPTAMALLTATGLTTALVSDTWGDWWSWVGLGIPVLVMVWYSWSRRPPVTSTDAAPSQPHPEAHCGGNNPVSF